MIDEQGTYRCYVPTKFGAERLQRIGRAAAILEEYEQKGLVMSLRQLYYQLVSRGAIPNEDKMYDQLKSDVSEGRLAGLISWTSLEDRGRNLRGNRYFVSPGHALHALTDTRDPMLYRRDKWEDQEYRPEVWVEKQALEGVIGSICSELEVDFFACKGYSSQSEQWRAGRRLAGYVTDGQTPIIFHLGDHDPSGLDMTRDNRDRLSMFAGVPINVVRIGLNMDQIRRLNPLPNPAKISDARYADYAREYGDESWELDALNPAYIRDLIRDAVARVRDEKKWAEAVEAEQQERDVIAEVSADLGYRDAEERDDDGE